VSQDFSEYSAEYYQRNQFEYWFEQRGLLRPDQLAAICYTLNLPFTAREPCFSGQEWPRRPGVIMSVGAGSGMLEHVLEELGHEVIGVDPSPGARELYRGKHLQDDVTGIEDCSTVIFCESLEHLPLDVIWEIWKQIPVRPGVRVIGVNWPGYFPIPVTSEWDHITELNDELYDQLAGGFTTYVRWGSHLVLDR
jgi:hypothetical protein